MRNSPIQIQVIDFSSSYLAELDSRMEICTPYLSILKVFRHVGRELRRFEDFVFTIHVWNFRWSESFGKDLSIFYHKPKQILYSP